MSIGVVLTAIGWAYQDIGLAVAELSNQEKMSFTQVQAFVTDARLKLTIAIILVIADLVLYFYSKLLINIPRWLSESEKDT
tara:strand:+ start:839 stop:1081 length:243 start_codon:yes stop_codon:yes gene_type:complete